MFIDAIRWLGAGRLVIPLALLLLGEPLVAQGAPSLPPAVNPEAINAETRRRQQDLERDVPPPAAGRVTVAPRSDAPSSAPALLRFRLLQVVFSASDYLSPTELAALAQPYIGRDIGFDDLQAIVDAVNKRYDALGIATARATLAQQTIADGIVNITLVEGRIGDTRIEGGSPQGQALVKRRVVVRSGTLADIPAIEAELVRFNRSGDSQLRATVVPGNSFGQTDLVLSLFEPKRAVFDIFVDNNSFETTGRWQAGGVARFHRLLTGDDRLIASAVISDGVRTGAASYSVGIDDRNTRLGLSYAHGQTRVTKGALAEFGIRGTSDSLSANLSTILLAGPRTSLSGTASGQYTRSRTQVDGLPVGDTELLSADLSLGLVYAVPGTQLVVTPSMSVVRADERLLNIARTLILFRLNLFAEKMISDAVRLRGRGDMQLAVDRDLPGVLQYQIGGTASARGYAPGVAGGDSGYSVGLEAGYVAGTDQNRAIPYIFIDQAGVFAQNGDVTIRSAGGGVTFEFARRFTIDSYLAKSLKDPVPGIADLRVVVALGLRF